MKRCFVMLIMAFAVNPPVWAASRTVALAIPGMTCAACPITLKIALNRVTGVTAATVNFDKRQAIVTFDDAKTNAEALVRATGDAGYPSTVIEGITQ
ncbi:mercury resistance system periplasmic binding protein MerP [Candidatus Methylobacter oryzae]|uniref:Periplasmic mercury ion-binding protein n=1 Tax=Candidatus Methylobacter oryzae TaxID=2497749 RepID=A0ABY3C9D5_9GAMM|nr:mercury resistance system periplasmic binding protein MerP [Candidatus Methylobacter oryzae]TRW93099.1 mercury resistance system periplasmic binding protein MerP [Candidatus Methylobacter oryzae]